MRARRGRGLDRKQGQDGRQTRRQAAAALARKLAAANPERTFRLVGDSAYVNAAVLQGRPRNLQGIGPPPWNAALNDRPAPRRPQPKGVPRTQGDRLPHPKARIEDAVTYPAELLTIAFPKPTRELRVPILPWRA